MSGHRMKERRRLAPQPEWPVHLPLLPIEPFLRLIELPADTPWLVKLEASPTAGLARSGRAIPPTGWSLNWLSAAVKLRLADGKLGHLSTRSWGRMVLEGIDPWTADRMACAAGVTPHHVWGTQYSYVATEWEDFFNADA